MAKEFRCVLTIALPSERIAGVLKDCLDVDEELAPERLTRTLSVSGNQLTALIEAVDLKMLRTGISSFVDMSTVCAKTILAFDES